MKKLGVLKDELAKVADAVGISHDGVMLGSTLSCGVVLRDGQGYWNPLTDDADSRRLQVALAIDLFIKHESAEAVGPGTAVCIVQYGAFAEREEGISGAKEAAARLAVFEAAVLVVGRRERRLGAAGEKLG